MITAAGTYTAGNVVIALGVGVAIGIVLGLCLPAIRGWVLHATRVASRLVTLAVLAAGVFALVYVALTHLPKS